MNLMLLIVSVVLCIIFVPIGINFVTTRLIELYYSRKGYIWVEYMSNSGKRFRRMVKPEKDYLTIKIDGQQHQFKYDNAIGNIFNNERGIVTASYDQNRTQINYLEKADSAFDAAFIDNIAELHLHQGMVSAKRINKYDELIKMLSLIGIAVILIILIFNSAQINELLTIMKATTG